MKNKHTQQVDFSNPNANKITSGTTNKPLENKQSAVEWLVSELNQKIDFIPIDKWDMIRDIVQQAKAMEKEQMDKVSEDWWVEGCSYMKDNKRIYESFEQYYNQTYGKAN